MRRIGDQIAIGREDGAGEVEPLLDVLRAQMRGNSLQRTVEIDVCCNALPIASATDMNRFARSERRIGSGWPLGDADAIEGAMSACRSQPYSAVD